MKNLKSILAVIATLTIGIGGVNASAQKVIDTTKCDTVYTNYYFFLSANTSEYFSDGFHNGVHNSIGEFTNNFYLTSNFDSNNIGYGEVYLTRTSTTSIDGITSMSLSDYYGYYLKSAELEKSTFSEGNKNIIFKHDWYIVNSDGSTSYNPNGAPFASYSKQSLIDATLNASVTMKLLSNVSPTITNPFQISISRVYYGGLTNKPIAQGENSWYLQPAVFYVQYCSPKETSTYTVTFNPNATDVTNMSSSITATVGNSIVIPRTIPVRSGYTFNGYSVNQDASVGEIKPGTYYSNNKNVTLYAVWTPNNNDVLDNNTYTIHYNANGTNVTNMPTDYTQNVNYDAYISTNVPVREGYTFLGWSTTANATTNDSNYNGGSLYKNRKDLTLYAVWKKNSELPENPQTGISDYLLPCGGAVGASLVGLNLIKRKRLFKQF